MITTLHIALLAVMAGFLVAGDSGIPVAPTAKPGVKADSALELVAKDEKWEFQPTVGRPDVFVDQEAYLILLRNQVATPVNAGAGIRPTLPGIKVEDSAQDIDRLVSWAKQEEEKVRQFVTARRYDDAVKHADGVLKQLEVHTARPDVAPIIVAVRTFRQQAEEAKIRDDAQVAFDAMKIRILGVLWSQEGMRLAIIDGETTAKLVNDRVKDSTIIDIGQDQVVFRFNFQRRRFEFPVFVDQLNARSKP